MLYIPLINPKRLSIARNIRLTLAAGLLMSCVLVTVIGLTSWYALKSLNEKLENMVTSQVKTAYIYDMRIAARERNLHIMKMLASNDIFVIDDEWMGFRNEGTKFLIAREAYKKQVLNEGENNNEIKFLSEQRELSKKAVALQYEMHQMKMDGNIDGAMKKLNEHFVYQVGVFSLLDNMLISQKSINSLNVEETRSSQEAAVKKVVLLSSVVVIVIFFMTSYMIKRLSQQAVDIENESMKFKALIEGSMDAVLVLEMHNVIDGNVNALSMFGVSSLKELNRVGLDYYSKFSDVKSSDDSDEIFSAINHVLVDVKRRYQWEFVNDKGKGFPADVELTGIELEGNKYVQMVIRDVTEREKNQQELLEANNNLEQKVLDRTSELNELNKKMVDIARSAGMAEVASGVLHNVGNVLNSVNVSTALLKDQIKVGRLDNIEKLATMLSENRDNLAEFLENDEKGKLIIEYIEQLSEHVKQDKENQLEEIETLAGNVDHIKSIISMQQTYSGKMGVIDKVKASTVLEDAININISSLKKHGVNLVRSYENDPVVLVDKHKLIQILVNLISNAKYAVLNGKQVSKIIVVKIVRKKDEVVYSVEDNGIGIEEKDVARIFEFGFKKRIGGHGYGLHHSALMAKELGGLISVESKGLGEGAIFTLTIPV
ncbi:MAG: hypothetical protein DIZ80_09470 [endosymbiont of Galathealinum brachiosum]|uniref:histidine kinase n=1 Tax=endosymbiont of Galathealinum brachiosum TaxID=2200906 RepID=A0A370DC90_9GAMM|nr:MAG: hypothetical protein DIZ80_09470 [endosymbiont of Galathealinum brachiosum]